MSIKSKSHIFILCKTVVWRYFEAFNSTKMHKQKDISYQHNMAGSVRINTNTLMDPTWKF